MMWIIAGMSLERSWWLLWRSCDVRWVMSQNPGYSTSDESESAGYIITTTVTSVIGSLSRTNSMKLWINETTQQICIASYRHNKSNIWDSLYSTMWMNEWTRIKSFLIDFVAWQEANHHHHRCKINARTSVSTTEWRSQTSAGMSTTKRDLSSVGSRCQDVVCLARLIPCGASSCLLLICATELIGEVHDNRG